MPVVESCTRLNWGINVSELGLQCMPVLLSHYFADNIVTNSIKTKNGPHQKQTSKQKTFKKKQTKYPKSGGLKDKSPSSQSYGFSSSHVWM